MPRFSANISMLFTERPMLERPLAAREAGFDGIEMQFPYSHSAVEWQAALADAGLPLVLFNLAAGDMMIGGPGLASMPGREAQYKTAIEEALHYAAELRPARVNVLAGSPPAAFDRHECRAVLSSNLRMAARAFEPLGVGVMTEAINTFDRPGFMVSTSAQAVEMLELVDHPNLSLQHDLYHMQMMEVVLQRQVGMVDQLEHPNLSLQHDLYHMQMMEGRLAATLEALLPRIGHLQFADAPGRHEPGTGEIRFEHLFALVDRLGYDGFVGAEYVPSRLTEDTLDWMKAARRVAAP